MVLGGRAVGGGRVHHMTLSLEVPLTSTLMVLCARMREGGNHDLKCLVLFEGL